MTWRDHLTLEEKLRLSLIAETKKQNAVERRRIYERAVKRMIRARSDDSSNALEVRCG